MEKGPLDPDGLREATGKAVRNLGPEGKKKGLTTTLPSRRNSRPPAIFGAFPPTGVSIGSAINTPSDVPIHCATSNSRRSRSTLNSRENTSLGSDQHRLPIFKLPPASA
jgi:hypothetical protein